MLQQEYRFHGHASLRYVYKHGKTVRSRALSVRFVANPRREHSRVAVVVARKVLKSAPKRNRVRRRIYEFLRTNWDHIAPAHDFVLSVFEPYFYDIPSEELQAVVKNTLKRAKLWR